MTLSGRTVVVTRAAQDAATLVSLLQARGAQVLTVPLIRFGSPSQPQALHARLRDLQGLDWLLLTSPQGVKALLTELKVAGLGLQVLTAVKIAVVGESTARPLRAAGLHVEFLPSIATARHLALELPARAGERALHLTSHLAEDHLHLGLEERGIEYLRLEAYRTEVQDHPPEVVRQVQQADVMTLTSGSAARHLAALAGTQLRVVALGEQTARAARQAGFQQVAVSKTPTLEGLVQAVEDSVIDLPDGKTLPGTAF